MDSLESNANANAHDGEQQRGQLIFISGLWKKKSRKTGDLMLTGKLNMMTNILVLKNTRKTKETEPDYKMFFARSLPREKPVEIVGDDLEVAKDTPDIQE